MKCLKCERPGGGIYWFCPRCNSTTDGTYACCRDGYLAGAEPREKCIEELEKENGKLEGKLEGKLDRVESENVRLIGKLAFTENTLNNCIAQIEELKKENVRLKENCNELQELVTYYQTNFCQEQNNKEVDDDKERNAR